jgi:hypothetical protein
MPRDDFEPKWNDRGMHCGHLPLNMPTGRGVFFEENQGVRH